MEESTDHISLGWSRHQLFKKKRWNFDRKLVGQIQHLLSGKSNVYQTNHKTENVPRADKSLLTENGRFSPHSLWENPLTLPVFQLFVTSTIYTDSPDITKLYSKCISLFFKELFCPYVDTDNITYLNVSSVGLLFKKKISSCLTFWIMEKDKEKNEKRNNFI